MGPDSAGVDYLALGDEGYPALLREIHDPPAGLYRRGPYGFDRPGVAVVGSRRATHYGLRIARDLGADLARRGLCGISGMARGIDTAAHEGALEAGGPTVAVLGTGLDVVYPPENDGLHRRIGQTGAVLSEFPFGRAPDRRSFPMRNRIVSGLSLAVVVVESAADGGAMITARLAGEQGRSLFAVPGRIDQPSSAGCHQLIRDGATLLTEAGDILEELAYLAGRLPPAPAAEPRRAAARTAALAPDEARLWTCFRGGAIIGRDALSEPTGLPAARSAAGLLGLELKGFVARRLDGTYEAVR